MDQALRSVHDYIRNTHARAVIKAGAEIGMQADVRTNKIDDCIRVAINRRTRNVLVPGTIRRKRTEAIQARALSGRNAAALTLRIARSAARPSAGATRAIARSVV